MNDEGLPKPIVTLTIFDICDTLYAQNTTFGFIRFLMRGRKFFVVLDALATNRWSPLFIGAAIIGKVTGKDYLRKIYLRFLSGIKRTDLDAAADAYVTKTLDPLALNVTHAALTDALERGQTVFLVSSSIDCVAKAIARRLGTFCLSSKLEFRHDACTGRLALDLTGKKKEAILTLTGLNVGCTYVRVFTDNVTDMDLVRFANEATIILPNGRGKEKWAGCEVKFINV